MARTTPTNSPRRALAPRIRALALADVDVAADVVALADPTRAPSSSPSPPRRPSISRVHARTTPSRPPLSSHRRLHAPSRVPTTPFARRRLRASVPRVGVPVVPTRVTARISRAAYASRSRDSLHHRAHRPTARSRLSSDSRARSNDGVPRWRRAIRRRAPTPDPTTGSTTDARGRRDATTRRDATRTFATDARDALGRPRAHCRRRDANVRGRAGARESYHKSWLGWTTALQIPYNVVYTTNNDRSRCIGHRRRGSRSAECDC